MKYKDLYAVLCIETVETKKMRVFGKLDSLIERRKELIKAGYSASILVNTREHSFDYILDNETEFEIPESGIVVNAKATTKKVGYSGGIKFIIKQYKLPEQLPELEGVYWIISSMTARVIPPDRKDMVLANTVNTDNGTKCNSFVLLNI
jgi:hypothetical protein